MTLDAFREIVLADFEFHAPPGERPEPACLVFKLLRAGRTVRLWRDEMPPEPPFPVDAHTLFVAYYAGAELGCFRVLGWPMPARILDLYVEFRERTNGIPPAAGNGLIGALTYFGLDTIGAVEKADMRAIFIRGGPYSDQERAAGLDYCEGDVAALERLLPATAPQIDLPRALLRGRYMAAASAMEHNGVPTDVPMLAAFREHWTGIQDALIADVDVTCGFNVYDGRTFKIERFEQYLGRAGIPWWERTKTGRLSLSDDTFRQIAKSYPQVAPLRELRSALSDMRLNDLSVGRDGRNRTVLWAFQSRTGRNQPSNTRFIFGPSTWLRGLIKPPPGYGVAYVDWSQQEFGIAAALSGDAAMQTAYLTGDPYLAFAKQAGAVPTDATKATHGPQRELFKQCVLGVAYGMEAHGLALRINQAPIIARELLLAHRETYRRFWRWSDAAVDCAMLSNSLSTVFGWHVHIGRESNPRSLRNFPAQANGAEMLRLACCLATEREIEVCAPVHDAVLICARLDRLAGDVARMQACMAEAARDVLAEFELRTDAHVVAYPDRYMDPRGAVMWDRVCKLIAARVGTERAA